MKAVVWPLAIFLTAAGLFLAFKPRSFSIGGITTPPRNDSAWSICRPSIRPDFASHPRVGVTSYVKDIPEGYKKLARAKPVPPAREWPCKGQGLALLWVTQAKRADRLPELYQQMTPLLVLEWGPKNASPGHVHMPKSTVGEGRNLLILTAREQEHRQGWRWDYIIVTDEDIAFRKGSPDTFMAFLSKYLPAVGAPYYGCDEECQRKNNPQSDGAYATAHFDHIMLAYRDDTIPQLWPYRTDWDHKSCVFSSQWGQGVQMTVLYPGHTLVDATSGIENLRHEGAANSRGGARPCEWCGVTLEILQDIAAGPLGSRAGECFRVPGGFPELGMMREPHQGANESCINEMQKFLKQGVGASRGRLAKDACSPTGFNCKMAPAKQGYGVPYLSPVNAGAEERCGGWSPYKWPFTLNY